MEPRHLDDRTLAARLLSGSRLRGPLLGWAACSAAGTLASGIRPLRPNPARRVAADRELRKGRRNKFKNQKGLTRAFTSAKNLKMGHQRICSGSGLATRHCGRRIVTRTRIRSSTIERKRRHSSAWSELLDPMGPRRHPRWLGQAVCKLSGFQVYEDRCRDGKR